ncbi:nicotinamide phosphoribosyltransferase [Novimethylophilus kurashikiensis]|uniref:Nicotinamide phosphoribosyltransferase n=1 Tax=Novimethylophilus kurashikiensis TaxID=1825523 RepID=A0A2R5F9C3_9PROT|nr:nicotinate phosphoribosyltransferase [Novimethylophilus kurashikiensis]GBG14842.1 nicotinamide phosphoribosyltransferase [Novimethylophilus kurashikiensis]
MNMRVESTIENEMANISADKKPSPFALADFYKTGHPGMYPKATTKLVANFTPRSAKYAPVLPELYDNKIVWLGLQGFIQEYLIDTFNEQFFGMAKDKAVRKYMRRMDNALGAGVVTPNRLAALHDLGYLPLEIRAIPEGERVNIKVPPVLFISTHEDFAFVATYFETLISTEMWKPSTVATIAFEFRKLLTYFARLTGAPEWFVDLQGHDFSMRGMSGVHDAMRCGFAHLASFTGTDTIPAIDYAEDFYGANSDEALIGCSIPASEHSVMALRILTTMKRLQALAENAGIPEKEIRRQAELEVIREFVTVDYAEGLVSIVSDTFDFWNVITNISKVLKPEIEARKVNALGLAKVVFRPDSGDPVRILAGYRDEEVVAADDGRYVVKASNLVITEAEKKGAVQCLWDIYGGTATDNGYKVLNERVGLIYGDSITLERARDILVRLSEKGFASNNVVFGIGSFTYNLLSRDTFGWALKAIYAQLGEQGIEIYKDPATDEGTKKSAKGLLRVEKEGDDYVLYEQQSEEEFNQGALEVVFRDGKFVITTTQEEIRQRLRASWTCPEIGSIEWKVA